MKTLTLLAACAIFVAGWAILALAYATVPAGQTNPANPTKLAVPANQAVSAKLVGPANQAGSAYVADLSEKTGPRLKGHLRLAAPLVPQALPLLRAGESALFQQAGVDTSFSLWRSPEQLRALVANGQVDAVVAALPTAAVLARRGVSCVVLAAYAAPLWLVGPSDLVRQGEHPLDTFRRLLDREILLPFGPGNMPELALRVLAAQGGQDCPLRHCGSALEAVNLLRLGRGGAALLPEPSVSLATTEGGIVRLLDLREVWAATFPDHTDMPTACFMAVGPTAHDPALRTLLRQGFVEGMRDMEKNPQASLVAAKKYSPELSAVLERTSNDGQLFLSSSVLAGERGRKAALFMLQRLMGLNPASVGGNLPANDFWDMGHEE
ncbi:ABC transporter substrate-binding protein [Desulfovibrio intestinalis]|uniref:NitT/TauT family transport system substrate-binding protein n=1 Tax=Desulfovibrio intestinalis TaxID=58621 RepID=A0A7W8BY59_9BACT|nr:ABC transporter substrate-binding protein [Desulfovibrio intestinalis]MBB5142106.1 NitT/TauT family transport system substrate-binding protein [Desulfovibrio intestinalis]